jgi:hypothetical protein
MQTSASPRLLPLALAGLAAFTFLGLAPAAAAEESPFGPIHVAANRAHYDGKGCPIEIIYTASINFQAPLPKGFVFNYRWERSDGAKGAEKVVRPAAGKRSMSVQEKWRLGAPGKHIDASVKLFVNSGNTHLSETSPTVSVTCR